MVDKSMKAAMSPLKKGLIRKKLGAQSDDVVQDKVRKAPGQSKKTKAFLPKTSKKGKRILNGYM